MAAHPPKRFSDRHNRPVGTFRDVLKIARTGGFADEKRAREEAKRIPIAESPRIDTTNATSVTWVGHATTIVRVAGATFLTDPVWSNRIPGFIRRLTPPGIPWDELPPIDGVVVSHDHYDHLDSPTFRRLPRDTPIHCGLRLGRFFRRRGFTHVHELEWWETVQTAGIDCTFVPVEHWCQRLPLMRDTNLWGGWFLREEGRDTRGVFFAGDTAYERWAAEIGARFAKPDAAILPIGAYEPQWFMKNVHMNPDEAVQAFLDLGARTLVPMHWGTFALTREPMHEPPRRLAAAWTDRRLAPERLAILPIGGTWTSR